MVTGQGNETTAVEAMKLGALDYVPNSSIITIQNDAIAFAEHILAPMPSSFEDKISLLPLA